MNKLATQLIKLGYTSPELRNHLTPILDAITKSASLRWSRGEFMLVLPNQDVLNLKGYDSSNGNSLEGYFIDNRNGWSVTHKQSYATLGIFKSLNEAKEKIEALDAEYPELSRMNLNEARSLFSRQGEIIQQILSGTYSSNSAVSQKTAIALIIDELDRSLEPLDFKRLGLYTTAKQQHWGVVKGRGLEGVSSKCITLFNNYIYLKDWKGQKNKFEMTSEMLISKIEENQLRSMIREVTNAPLIGNL